MKRYAFATIVLLGLPVSCMPIATPQPQIAMATATVPVPTATPTMMASPTLTPTMIPTITSTSTPTLTPTKEPTKTPEPSPTPIGNYVEAPAAGIFHTYGGDINFSTLPQTEQNEQATERGNAALGIIGASTWVGFHVYTFPGGADDYRHLVKGERRTNGEGHPVERPFSQLMIFKAKKNGSELMTMNVKQNDGTTKIVSGIEVEADTVDTKGNPVTVVLQIAPVGNLYLNVGGLGNTDGFYLDPALPHLKPGMIRAGDRLGLTVIGPITAIENAGGKEITIDGSTHIALFPNSVIYK